jgi:hypothetical protein
MAVGQSVVVGCGGLVAVDLSTLVINGDDLWWRFVVAGCRDGLLFVLNCGGGAQQQHPLAEPRLSHMFYQLFAVVSLSYVQQPPCTDHGGERCQRSC